MPLVPWFTNNELPCNGVRACKRPKRPDEMFPGARGKRARTQFQSRRPGVVQSEDLLVIVSGVKGTTMNRVSLSSRFSLR